MVSFVNFRLIPLNKRPGPRPTGVAQELRIIGKAVMLFTNNKTHAIGALKLTSTTQDAGTVLHATHDFFPKK